jgi:hypothetical protein
MGARVDQVWTPAAAVQMSSAPGAIAGGDRSSAGGYPPPAGWAPAVFAGRPASQEASGTDWVLWVRVAIAVPSVLVAALLMLAAIFVRHLTYQQDTATGVVSRTVDLGPDVLVLVLALLAVTALFVYLARFSIFRVILLGLTLVSVLSALSQLGDALSGERVAYLALLGWDILYGALLGLSLITPRPR